jgi:hypothetical protein
MDEYRVVWRVLVNKIMDVKIAVFRDMTACSLVDSANISD